MAKPVAKTALPIQTVEQVRAAFEANLTVLQKVYLRYAFNEINHTTGAVLFAAQGRQGRVCMVEDMPAGRMYHVSFRGLCTLNGEEKPTQISRMFSASDLCATRKEALRG